MRTSSANRMRPEPRRARGGGGALSTDERRYAGSLMYNWRSGQGDPVYAVASYFVGGKTYPDMDVVRRARDSLEQDLRKAKKGLNDWGPADARELETILVFLDKDLGQAVSIERGIEAMLNSYADAILSTETDGDGDLLKFGFSSRGFSKEATAKMRRDVAKFAREHAADIGENWAQAGTDLWLTRSEFRVGFDDRPHVYGAAAAKRLNQAARKLGPNHVEVFRGKIKVS